MLEKCYREIEQNQNVRENLSLIRREIKAQDKLAHFFRLAGNGELLMKLLCVEDAKARRNAALLLGDMALPHAAAPLWEAYCREETLFVKSAYLTALGKIGVPGYLGRYEERLAALSAEEIAEEERKHIAEEIRALEQNIIALRGVKSHTFTGVARGTRLVLAVSRELRDAVMAELSGTLHGAGELHPLGVLVRTRDGNVAPYAALGTCRELLFPIQAAGELTGTPAEMAEMLMASDLPGVLRGSHAEDGPFYFRLEIRGGGTPDGRGSLAKKLGAELERLSGRSLINSTDSYEVEIRLLQTKTGGYMPFYKLFTWKRDRFSYRKHAIATSIHPAMAAAVMRLAKPHLKERAQILDPFCGVGTMLAEREFCVTAGEKYGIDIFGDAISMARENAAAAGLPIRFINRDYFEFRHDRLFDEIVTNMPVRGKKTKEEMDAFYGKFFEKSAELLRDGAVLLVLSGEEGFLKKQLRLRREYRLIEERCIRERDHFCFYLMQYRGSVS